jgi:hypothetical protein
MSTLQPICAIEPAAARSMALAVPVAKNLILGTLLLLIRP